MRFFKGERKNLQSDVILFHPVDDKQTLAKKRAGIHHMIFPLFRSPLTSI